eukprot:gnl/TRDRNA2_/TRDRNA2_176466_c3_seq4.p1 gnl/TRDRNA2_/TRDRNA2_176466_c3~~gnl/TRDRNA2_/TRDRNA2_176466_c3_seq4.p1  ORF type:complete len:352 (+),score=68.62 gnl/TRDRNA2_/TRDRNA2_176466_c3_seq4:106-1161(+)
MPEGEKMEISAAAKSGDGTIANVGIKVGGKFKSPVNNLEGFTDKLGRSLMALGDCLAHVGSFFSERELAAAEQAPILKPDVAAQLLEKLTDAAAEEIMLWDWRTRAGHAGKKLLYEMKLLHKHFVPLSRLSSVIDVPTLGSIRARPPKSLETSVVSIPIALRTTFGQPLNLAVRLHEVNGSEQEATFVGVIIAGASGRRETSQKILFAPSTGRVFHEYHGGDLVMGANVMPPLPFENGQEDVEVCIQVLPDGGMCFLRRHQQHLQASGILPRKSFAGRAFEYFAAVFFKPRDLQGPTVVSMNSDINFPEHISNIEEFSAVWAVLCEPEADEEAPLPEPEDQRETYHVPAER